MGIHVDSWGSMWPCEDWKSLKIDEEWEWMLNPTCHIVSFCFAKHRPDACLDAINSWDVSPCVSKLQPQFPPRSSLPEEGNHVFRVSPAEEISMNFSFTHVYIISKK